MRNCRIRAAASPPFLPFTQTRYVSGLRKADELYNTSLVLPGNGCTQDHFGMVLESFPNMTEDLFVGLVVGKLEEFDADELILFPTFILNLHGQH